ncbi:MAG: TIGR02221 family CRISPR-associated protein, partial [Chloroherpetonaceae bacterium]|nr:TIGR02221 family CRISPR-associated protein [Chloroherpetonaceae bacterium]
KCQPNIKEARCSIIPVGRNSDEMWEIFRIVTSRCKKNDVISVDITQGLRYQSAFLLLAVVMLRTIKSVEVDSVFYGAFELKDDAGAPILDLKPLVEILDWTLATNDFQSYSNTKKINELLAGDTFKSHRDAFSAFSTALQINALDRVVSEANRIRSLMQQEQIKTRLPIPATLLLPDILELPSRLTRNPEDWENYLTIARWQFEHEQIGLSVLSTWEALINRAASILHIHDYASNYKAYIELSKIVRAKDNYAQHLSEINKLTRKADTLNEYRKAIAHADGVRVGLEKLELPSRLTRNPEDWENYLTIARWQFEHEQIGLSVLSTWEALINRAASILHIHDYASNYKAYIELSKIVRAKDNYAQHLSEINELTRKADTLNDYRNAIAHADGVRVGLENFRAEFRKLLGYFEQELQKEAIKTALGKEVIRQIFQQNLQKSDSTTKS